MFIFRLRFCHRKYLARTWLCLFHLPKVVKTIFVAFSTRKYMENKRWNDLCTHKKRATIQHEKLETDFSFVHFISNICVCAGVCVIFVSDFLPSIVKVETLKVIMYANYRWMRKWDERRERSWEKVPTKKKGKNFVINNSSFWVEVKIFQQLFFSSHFILLQWSSLMPQPMCHNNFAIVLIALWWAQSLFCQWI